MTAFGDCPLNAAKLCHDSVEEEEVVRAHPDAWPAEVEHLEPVEHVHILLQVHLPNQAAETRHAKKTIFTPTSLVPKSFYPKKCVNYNKIKLSTKMRKMPKRHKKFKKGQKLT